MDARSDRPTAGRRGSVARLSGEGLPSGGPSTGPDPTAPHEAPHSDAVNLPDHYARYAIEPIRFAVENFGRGVLIGKIVKYAMRSPFKGKPVEDLEKARRCLDMLEKFDAGDPDWWKHPVGEKTVGG